MHICPQRMNGRIAKWRDWRRNLPAEKHQSSGGALLGANNHTMTAAGWKFWNHRKPPLFSKRHFHERCQEHRLRMKMRNQNIIKDARPFSASEDRRDASSNQRLYQPTKKNHQKKNPKKNQDCLKSSTSSNAGLLPVVKTIDISQAMVPRAKQKMPLKQDGSRVRCVFQFFFCPILWWRHAYILQGHLRVTFYDVQQPFMTKTRRGIFFKFSLTRQKQQQSISFKLSATQQLNQDTIRLKLPEIILKSH